MAIRLNEYEKFPWDKEAIREAFEKKNPDIFISYMKKVIKKLNKTYSEIAIQGNQIIDEENSFINVKRDFGAKGDGVTDDTAAIQEAIDVYDTFPAVYFPTGKYKITSTLNVHGPFNIRGSGPRSELYTTNNIPMITVDVASADIYYANILDLAFVASISGTRTSNHAIYVTGTTNNYGPMHSTFRSLLFKGTYSGIYFNKTTPGGGSGRHDWNLFEGIKTINYVDEVEYGIYFNNGSGTGNIFSNLNLVTNSIGLAWMGSNGTIVGDIIINGINAAGNGTGIHLSSSADYRARISINGYQFDGNLTYGLVILDYSGISGVGSLGGSVTNDFTDTTNLYLIQNGVVVSQ